MPISWSFPRTARRFPSGLNCSLFGSPLLVSTYDGSGDLTSVTLFGMNVTALFEL